MKKIVLILFIILIGISTNLLAEDSRDSQLVKRLSEGKESAKITIIAYESLTCSHCADFHKNVYPDLKKDFIDKGLVKIEFRHFPLDIAAFNASKIGQCKNDGNPDILNILFSGQKKWARGKTPEEATIYLKKFLKDEGVKKFKVNATPTIIINDKKFDKALNYKNLKKYLEKLI